MPRLNMILDIWPLGSFSFFLSATKQEERGEDKSALSPCPCLRLSSCALLVVLCERISFCADRDLFLFPPPFPFVPSSPPSPPLSQLPKSVKQRGWGVGEGGMQFSYIQNKRRGELIQDLSLTISNWPVPSSPLYPPPICIHLAIEWIMRTATDPCPFPKRGQPSIESPATSCQPYYSLFLFLPQ